MPTGTPHSSIERSYIAERLRKVKYSSKNERDLDFNIDLEYICDILDAQEGKCALTGWPLQFTKGGTWKSGMNPFACSMDRVDNTQGYVRGNIQLVCAMVNTVRGAMENDDFINLCKAVAETNK